MDGAVSKVVSSLVGDIINPFLSIIFGAAGNLNTWVVHVGSAQVLIGDLISNIVDFVVIALVVYIGVKILGVDRLDKKKE